jgi:hypothetical protein
MAVRGSHNECCLIPELGSVGTGVKEVIQGFFGFSTEYTERRSHKASFQEVVPG